MEIIRNQIESCLPLQDPSKEVVSKKGKETTKGGRKQPGAGSGKQSAKGEEENKDGENAPQKTKKGHNSQVSRGSVHLNFEKSDTGARESFIAGDDDDEDTDSELENEKLEEELRVMRESSISLEEIEKRRQQAQEKYERKKRKIEEQEFLNQLRMFSLLTPSLEFIPEFKNMIGIMQ